MFNRIIYSDTLNYKMAVTSTFLIATFIIAVLGVFIVWHFTKHRREIPDNVYLELASKDDKILSSWYKSQRKNIYNVDENELASKLLSELYDIDVSPDNLLIGNKIKGKVKQLYNLRFDTGKSIFVAIVNNNKKDKIQLVRNHSFDDDIKDLVSAMPLIKEVKITLNEILDKRWHQLSLLNIDQPADNHDRSFLYLKTSIPKVNHKNGRINLLCSDLEFKTLLLRIKSNALIGTIHDTDTIINI